MQGKSFYERQGCSVEMVKNTESTWVPVELASSSTGALFLFFETLIIIHHSVGLSINWNNEYKVSLTVPNTK